MCDTSSSCRYRLKRNSCSTSFRDRCFSSTFAPPRRQNDTPNALQPVVAAGRSKGLGGRLRRCLRGAARRRVGGHLGPSAAGRQQRARPGGGGMEKGDRRRGVFFGVPFFGVLFEAEVMPMENEGFWVESRRFWGVCFLCTMTKRIRYICKQVSRSFNQSTFLFWHVDVVRPRPSGIFTLSNMPLRTEEYQQF